MQSFRTRSLHEPLQGGEQVAQRERDCAALSEARRARVGRRCTWSWLTSYRSTFTLQSAGSRTALPITLLPWCCARCSDDQGSARCRIEASCA